MLLNKGHPGGDDRPSPQERFQDARDSAQTHVPARGDGTRSARAIRRVAAPQYYGTIQIPLQ